MGYLLDNTFTKLWIVYVTKASIILFFESCFLNSRSSYKQCNGRDIIKTNKHHHSSGEVNFHKVGITSGTANLHLASLPLPLVVTVSALCSSFNLLKSFSSAPIHNRRSTSESWDGSASACENHIVGTDCAGPPGRRIAPTAVERDMLLGRTIKLLSFGIIRKPVLGELIKHVVRTHFEEGRGRKGVKPYRSPRLFFWQVSRGKPKEW